MVLKTKNPITHLDLEKLATGGNRQGVVRMVLGSRNFVVEQLGENKHLRKVEVTFVYLDDKDQVLPTINGNVFTVKDTEEQNDLVNNSIINLEPTLEASKNFSELYDQTVLNFAKIEFSKSYGLTIEDIEVI